MPLQNIFLFSHSHFCDVDDASHGSDSTPIFIPAQGVVPMERNSLQSSPLTLQVSLDCVCSDTTPLLEPRKGCVPFEKGTTSLTIHVPEEILLGHLGGNGAPSDSYMSFNGANNKTDLAYLDDSGEEDIIIITDILEDDMSDELSLDSALVDEKQSHLAK